MKNILFIMALFIQVYAWANMAQPIDRRGAIGSRPFTSKYVDIEHENLFITIDSGFNRARFRIEYHLNAQKAGEQIPLIFYASEWVGDFTVLVDGKPVETQQSLRQFTDGPFTDFGHIFGTSEDDNDDLFLSDSETTGFQVHLDDMVYFETNLSKGQHIIEVSYSAYRWRESKNWVNNYSFRYALSPAKYWKSFGTLDIYLDATEFASEITTNLGEPLTGSLNANSTWQFSELPVNVLEIYFQPKVSWFAQILITLTPLGIALITLLILLFIHLKLAAKYRLKKSDSKFNPVTIAGIILISGIFIAVWIFSFDFIDWVIGPKASSEHGYSSIFILMISPIVLALYTLLFKVLKRVTK